MKYYESYCILETWCALHGRPVHIRTPLQISINTSLNSALYSDEEEVLNTVTDDKLIILKICTFQAYNIAIVNSVDSLLSMQE